MDRARSGECPCSEVFPGVAFWRTFLLCQCWLMVFVIFASHARSLVNSATLPWKRT